MEYLFSYGTLQQEQVQLDTFGRRLTGQKDFLIGYIVGEVRIRDSKVIASSGKDIHPILISTGLEKDQVEGTVFQISKEELMQADSYEVVDYQRQAATLQSGQQAWIYAAAQN